MFLNFPQLQFFHLLSDVIQFIRTRESEKQLSEIQKAWTSLVESYPRWSKGIEPENPVDIVTHAMDDDPSVSLAKPEKRTALVIGNNFYSSAPLVSPANDADTLSRLAERRPTL